MTADEYVPSDEQIRDEWISAMTTEDPDNYWDAITDEEARARWSRWLAAHDARVRRDALTALADHWDETVSKYAGRPMFSASGTHVRHYRDTHYPEATP